MNEDFSHTLLDFGEYERATRFALPPDRALKTANLVRTLSRQRKLISVKVPSGKPKIPLALGFQHHD